MSRQTVTPRAETMMDCQECGMCLPAQRPVFHPHIYCMLRKAGVRDPDAYMRATWPLLRDHFGGEGT